MSTDGARERTLYSFLGLHSFLIGLFPFYIPVLLFTKGYSLGWLAVFISCTGLGYCLGLVLWQKFKVVCSFKRMVLASFVLEALLLVLFFQAESFSIFIAAAFVNGLYNCTLWTIQRLLFLSVSHSANSGRKFGNIQIFIVIILKAGILLGGILLEHTSYFWLFCFSLFSGMSGLYFFLQGFSGQRLAGLEIGHRIPRVSEIITYRDTLFSKPIFAVDGIFLYLESYFWLVSLYLLVQESYVRLSLVVVILALFFSLLFILLKNHVDSLPRDRVYAIAVSCYILSWLLRAFLSDSLPLASTLILLALVAFFTSIFRLVFNKRLFDNAQEMGGASYVIVKSYYSQIFLLGLLLPAPLLSRIGVTALPALYLLAMAVAPMYYFYRRATARLA